MKELHQRISGFLNEARVSVEEHRSVVMQWMEERYRIEFERIPVSDFVFEAEEIIYDAQKQNEEGISH